MRFAQCKLREGSVASGSEILRGVYPERSEGLRMTGLDLLLVRNCQVHLNHA